MLIQLLANCPQKALRYSQTVEHLHIVLLQDGIYAAQYLIDSGKALKCFALQSDWAASGLPKMANVELINHQQWVGLCALKRPVVSIQL